MSRSTGFIVVFVCLTKKERNHFLVFEFCTPEALLGSALTSCGFRLFGLKQSAFPKKGRQIHLLVFISNRALERFLVDGFLAKKRSLSLLAISPIRALDEFDRYHVDFYLAASYPLPPAENATICQWYYWRKIFTQKAILERCFSVADRLSPGSFCVRKANRLRVKPFANKQRPQIPKQYLPAGVFFKLVACREDASGLAQQGVRPAIRGSESSESSGFNSQCTRPILIASVSGCDFAMNFRLSTRKRKKPI